MNHLKHYVALMRKGFNRKSPKIFERHHVFPVSIYGENSYTVKLTPREHYVAHELLYYALKKRYGKKHQKTRKMLAALILLGAANFNQGRRRMNSHIYEKAKEELRITLSEVFSGAANPNYGKKHSPETRAKIVSKLTGKKYSAEVRKNMGDGKRGKYWFHNGETSVKRETCPEGFLPGRPKSLSSKLSQAMAGRVISEEVRQRQRERMTGEGNHQFGLRGEKSPNYGRKHTKESLEKMSKAQKGKKLSEEQRKKISESKKGEKSIFWGKKWFNNGESEILCFECPEGYSKGRLTGAQRKIQKQENILSSSEAKQ